METSDTLNGATVFESKRILARRWLKSDSDTIFEVYSDLDVSRWIEDGSPITREETELWLNVTATNYHQRGYGMFALQDKGSGDVAGFLGLVHPNGQLDVEIKYALRKSHWHRGLATEVVLATLEFAAQTLALPKITATVAPENIASQRVLTKAGFSFVEQRDDEDGILEFYYEWS